MSDPAIPTLAPEAPPNTDLFADVERDLSRVEQSLDDLTDESTDPDVAIDWLQTRSDVNSPAGPS